MQFTRLRNCALKTDSALPLLINLITPELRLALSQLAEASRKRVIYIYAGQTCCDRRCQQGTRIQAYGSNPSVAGRQEDPRFHIAQPNNPIELHTSYAVRNGIGAQNAKGHTTNGQWSRKYPEHYKIRLKLWVKILKRTSNRPKASVGQLPFPIELLPANMFDHNCLYRYMITST